MSYCFSSEYLSILEEIRETIKDKPNVTQKSLALELGISREHLTRLLSNYYPMKGEQLIYLICRLGIKNLL